MNLVRFVFFPYFGKETFVPNHSVITKAINENVRTVSRPAADIPAIGADISKQPQERTDDLFMSSPPPPPKNKMNFFAPTRHIVI